MAAEAVPAGPLAAEAVPAGPLAAGAPSAVEAVPAEEGEAAAAGRHCPAVPQNRHKRKRPRDTAVSRGRFLERCQSALMYWATMAFIWSHWASISATSLNWVRARSRFCPGRLMWK